MTISKLKTEASERNQPCRHLTVNFWPLECEKIILVLKATGLQYFAMGSPSRLKFYPKIIL